MIPPLEHLSLWQRILLAIVLVLLTLFLLYMAAQVLGSSNVEAQPQLPPKGALVGKPSPWDTRLVEMDREALDNAYHDQLQHLFLGWMKDDSGQPERAIRGAQQARRAYILVRTEIERRAEIAHKLEQKD
jgi:hypothetical protein